MQVVYNKDCSTYNIHILYSMMKVRNENYRLKKLGYVPILKCMEYVSNSDFVSRFDEETAIRLNYYYWNEKNALYGEKIYVDCSTISGINVRFVEPIDIFDRIAAKIRPTNIFKIIHMTFCSEYIQCFRYVLQRYKTYYGQLVWTVCGGQAPAPHMVRSTAAFAISERLLVMEVKIYSLSKPEFALIYNEYFPQ